MPSKKTKAPKSLGQHVLEKKLATWEQLESALARKLAAGGHLATSLIELDTLDEKSARSALTGASTFPAPPAGAFDTVGDEVTGAIPAELARRRAAVPFDVKRKVLQVAMVDPADQDAVAEISDCAGCKVKFFIAPEPRIHQALEALYGLPMPERFSVACRILDGEDVEPVAVPAIAAGAGPQAGSVAAADAYPARWETDPGRDGPPAGDDPAGSYLETGIFTGSAPGVTVVAEPDFSPDELLGERLCGAETVQDLAEAALDYARDSFPRCALFAVKSDIAKVWSTRGLNLDAERAKAFETALNVNPVFQLLTVHDHYRGPLPAEQEYRKFYASLDLAFPSETLLVPGFLDDKIRVIFYGDSGENGKIQGETQTYLGLAGKLALALKVIALKSRLRA